MEKININVILDRENEEKKIKDILIHFEDNKHDLTIKKSIYIYGEPGTGKTTFVTNILKDLNYDIIKYDSGDVRTKSIIETITKNNMSDRNVMSMFNKSKRKVAVIMDEIDGMNSGDKGGITSLIKIIRPKKTKKQKLEEQTMVPIICIGNYHVDKKIQDLIKVSHVIELKIPTQTQVYNLLKTLMPNLDKTLINNIVQYIQGDLRKIVTLVNLYKNKETALNSNLIKNIFIMKSFNDDTKHITKKIINNYYPFEKHLNVMNETDRTIVGLLWHENIIDVINNYEKKKSIPFYSKILNNMCLADYIDRITFQKQIWQFNEMSSLIKTFYNNKILHDTFPNKPSYNPSEVRFTKVLTKYSTEFNNSVFIQNLCQELSMDKKDLLVFFLFIRDKYSEQELLQLFENYEITKLDINRIYRYIDKYIKEDAPATEDIQNDDINDEQ
jgi:adenylate kinase family enzyme